MTHVPYYFQKAALNFTRSYDDVPSSEYYVNEPAKASRFQEFVDDIISTVKCGDVNVLQTSLPRPLLMFGKCRISIFDLSTLKSHILY